MTKRISNLDIVDTTDIRSLSLMITEHTEKNLSELALNRFFELTPSNLPPSKYTLDTLSKYCGFDNWADFHKRN